MLDSSRGRILEPVACATHNIEFAVWIVGRTVLARFVMVTRAMDITIVLSDVEVDSPRPEFVRHFFVGCVELGLEPSTFTKMKPVAHVQYIPFRGSRAPSNGPPVL